MARRKSGNGVSKESIVEATVAAILATNLTDWTVDSVAGKAKCAKGLVLYHFKSKGALLLQVADTIRNSVANGRLEAVSGTAKGAAALDRLWGAMAEGNQSGEFGLWVGLLADSRTRKAAARATHDDADLIRASAEALGIQRDSLALSLIPAALDGFALELLQGNASANVRERFDSFWLGVLSDAENERTVQ